MDDPRREANLLGTLALVLCDRTGDAVTAASGLSQTAAVAVSVLYHVVEQPTIDLLRQVLGLTSSGTVRLVDRLVEAGHVVRGRGGDGRSTVVTLTGQGRQVAERIGGARAAVLQDALARLSPADRAALTRITGDLLVGFVRGPGATRWICRLCDTGACGRAQGRCPVANAAQGGPAVPAEPTV